MFDMISDFIVSSEEALKRLEIDIKSVAIEELLDILYASIENQLCNSESERLQQIARCKIIKGIQEKLTRKDIQYNKGENITDKEDLPSFKVKIPSGSIRHQGWPCPTCKGFTFYVPNGIPSSCLDCIKRKENE